MCQHGFNLTCWFAKIDALEVVCEEELLVLFCCHQPLVFVQAVGEGLCNDKIIKYVHADTFRLPSASTYLLHLCILFSKSCNVCIMLLPRLPEKEIIYLICLGQH